MIKRKNSFGTSFESNDFNVFFLNKGSYNFINKAEKEIIFSKQVHGSEILELEGNFVKAPFSFLNEADGIHCGRKEQGLGIQTADCVPCFLYSKKDFFSLHLGWRSLVGGLLDKALSTYTSETNLELFVGPHITQDSFEVGEEVVEIFEKKHCNNKEWYKVKNGRHYISLLKIIEQKCSNYDVKIYKDETNTFDSKDHFSYRRAIKANKITPYRNISFAFMK